MGLLGTGRNEAWIYDKNGTRAIAPLENAASVRWTRALNEISSADAVVATGTHAECCSILGQIGTWGHSLVVFRNGVRSWEGPITNIKWTRGGVGISAHDVLGWSMRKTTATARFIEAPNWVIAEGVNDINALFATTDPNVLAHVQVIGAGTGPQVTRDVKAYGGFYSDQLADLVQGGLMYTVIGRRIVLWPNTSSIGRATALLPTEHMSGEIEIEEDGMDLSTDTVAVNDEGLAGIYNPGVDAFYGQVEQLVSSAATTTASLTTIAQVYHENRYPAPLKVNVPAGSVLSCDAPYDIEELIAGTIIPVKVDEGVCRRVEATQQLSQVEVTDGAEGEKVAITLVPVSGGLV